MLPQHSPQQLGIVALFGSGETSPSGRKVFDYVLRQFAPAPRLALLETPAGFELNSDRVIGRIAEFIQLRLQNFRPEITVVPARRRGTPFSPDNPEILEPLLEADLIFMGPGSPTYAVRQLHDSLAWRAVLARHRLGAALVLASAATIAVSSYALPVYEIYKVGEDLHWKPGLDLFGMLGFPMVVIPHWNNNDGGDELDTSCCFMGKQRFIHLMEMLPPGLPLFGIDEKTALVLDLHTGTCQVLGLGGVVLLHSAHEHLSAELPALPTAEPGDSWLQAVAERSGMHVHRYLNGETFPLEVCCPVRMPHPGEGLAPEIWRQALELHSQREEARQGMSEPASPPLEVLTLVEERQAARQRKDWQQSDVLRQRITAAGWQVLDTPEGPKLQPASPPG